MRLPSLHGRNYRKDAHHFFVVVICEIILSVSIFWQYKSSSNNNTFRAKSCVGNPMPDSKKKIIPKRNQGKRNTSWFILVFPLDQLFGLLRFASWLSRKYSLCCWQSVQSVAQAGKSTGILSDSSQIWLFFPVPDYLLSWSRIFWASSSWSSSSSGCSIWSTNRSRFPFQIVTFFSRMYRWCMILLKNAEQTCIFAPHLCSNGGTLCAVANNHIMYWSIIIILSFFCFFMFLLLDSMLFLQHILVRRIVLLFWASNVKS